MIALRDRTKARRRPFAPGDIVRLDWPRNLYHGCGAAWTPSTATRSA